MKIAELVTHVLLISTLEKLKECDEIVWFQKICTPTHRGINGIPRGKKDLKVKNFVKYEL